MNQQESEKIILNRLIAEERKHGSYTDWKSIAAEKIAAEFISKKFICEDIERWSWCMCDISIGMCGRCLLLKELRE